ncbi:uncharacterized protein LOC130999617 [Salvia miltiorrhiza]|uniref:uncharacterized protein LOC130999617 n=1 Tax=Salvia miltiorrhiza TaxID=226208 RepID=UPI0025AB6FCB|nr:uncharacterized protein LOC130999617 [Salvia miltiorrhiza]
MMNSGQDDKFFSMLSSRDKRYNSSKQLCGEASFRALYYGGAAGTVPFLWESQPGTPKHKLSDGPLPPLTPPPQHQSSPLASPSMKKKHSKIFNSIFARTPSTKISAPTSLPSSPYSLSYSSPSTPLHSGGKESQKARLSWIGLEGEEEVRDYSATSTLCFRGSSSCRRSKSYYGYPIKSVKKVVKSITRRRHFSN